MLSYNSFTKVAMTISKEQDHSIPEGYTCITLPNKERFHHLLSDCRLENNGDKLHLHIPNDSFASLVELLHILVEQGHIS